MRARRTGVACERRPGARVACGATRAASCVGGDGQDGSVALGDIRISAESRFPFTHSGSDTLGVPRKEELRASQTIVEVGLILGHRTHLHSKRSEDKGRASSRAERRDEFRKKPCMAAQMVVHEAFQAGLVLQESRAVSRRTRPH